MDWGSGYIRDGSSSPPSVSSPSDGAARGAGETGNEPGRPCEGERMLELERARDDDGAGEVDQRLEKNPNMEAGVETCTTADVVVVVLVL
jgi:hypothetical protein